MKLHLVPASTGLQWVKLGVKTFFRQPLAMSGLFFMFMAAVSVISLVPVLGTAISLALVPAATLGLMAASQEAFNGRFPMPSLLISGFRAGPAKTRNMLILGAMYAAGLMLVLGVSAVFGTDVSPPAEMPEGDVSPEMVRDLFANQGLWAAMVLYLPLLMAFWHAPALVHWHGVSPLKSLFFSLLACWSNKGAMLVYFFGWVGVFMLVGLFMSLLATLLGGSQALNLILYPMVLFMASMFHTSIYFSVRDSFMAEDGTALPDSTSGDNA
ncbi:MAG: BPSS1780 family membrane protein [Hydrogenophaga sp.]|uniref:BPSS1780 family membrane protein n=1 Tax=Hydrogenophaga sp. TaxID=1904254 RepID=UPI003D13F2D3